MPLVTSDPNLVYDSRTYFNGNISAITWQTYNSGKELGYTYVYDKVNRIKGASHVHATGVGTWNTADAGVKVWRHENHPVTLETNEMIDDRINYIHENPVRSSICFEARGYKYSSVSQYRGEIGVLEIELVD